MFISIICLSSLCIQAFENEQPTVLITGSNRNIGLEFVQQFSDNNWNVIATARKPDEANELQAIATQNNNIMIEQLDVTNHKEIFQLAQKYKDQLTFVSRNYY